jgi:hypothetical protein
VFGPAHARGNKLKPGPCDGNGDWSGCYIGSWSSSDLVHWSEASQAVPLPDHHAAFNTRTTMVTHMSPDAVAVLPRHQAAMVLEPRSDHAFMNGARNAFFCRRFRMVNDRLSRQARDKF